MHAFPYMSQMKSVIDGKVDPPHNPRIVGYHHFEGLAVLARKMMSSFDDRQNHSLEFTTTTSRRFQSIPSNLWRWMRFSLPSPVFSVNSTGCKATNLAVLCFESDALFCVYYESNSLGRELSGEFTTIGISYLKSLVSEEGNRGSHEFWTALSRNEIGCEIVKRFRVSWISECTPECTHVDSPVYWRLNLCRWHEIEAHCYEFQHVLLDAAGVDQESQQRARDKWRLDNNPWGVYGLSNGIFAKMRT